MKELKKVIEHFDGTSVLAIGDLMIDQYLYGTVTRISPKPPLPIVNIDKEVCELGGAANAVNNINNLGGVVEAIGVIEKMFKHPLTDSGLESFLNDWKNE